MTALRQKTRATSHFFVLACLLWLPAPPLLAEPTFVEAELSRRGEPVTRLPDVYSFRAPISTCLLVLSLFNSRLPTMRTYKRLFHGFRIEEVSRPLDKKNKEGVWDRTTERTYSSVTADNIENLFAHQYDTDHPDQHGAKGLLYFDPDGKMRAILWRTGVGIVGNNIHHKDAIASVVETEARDLHRVIRELEQKGDIGTGLLALDLVQELNTVAENLHFNRKQDSFTEEMLHRFQGFQLTATRDRQGKLQVTKVQISSSVTSTQISRSEPMVVDQLNKGMELIRDSIAPDLRKYGPVEIDGLHQMALDYPDDLGVKGERKPVQTPVRTTPAARRPR